MQRRGKCGNKPTNKTVKHPAYCSKGKAKCFLCSDIRKAGKTRRKNLKRDLKFVITEN